MNKTVAQAVKTLRREHRKMPNDVRRAKVRWIIGQGVSMAELGRALGLSRQRIFQICHNDRPDN